MYGELTLYGEEDKVYLYAIFWLLSLSINLSPGVNPEILKVVEE